MKKSIKSVLAKSLAVAMAFSLAGIAPNTSSDAAAKKPSVTKKVTVNVGKTKTVKVTSKKKVKKTTWSLDKKGKKVVSLSKKKAKSVKVKGKKAGKATLTAKIKVGKKTTKAKCKITVKAVSTPSPTPVTSQGTNPTPTPAGPGGDKATPTPQGVQKDNKFKSGGVEITVEDKDDSVYPVTISDLNEVTWTSESKRPNVDLVTDGKAYNRDGSVSFVSLKDYNSGVCYYMNPCTDESQLILYDEDDERYAYRDGDKDMSAYDYIRVKVTCENELNLRTYNGSEQFENAGFPGSNTSETYEGGWLHVTEDSIWAEENTFSAGNTVKPEYATRTIFIPLSMLADKGCDLSTLTAIAFSPQGEGAECTIHYIDFVKVKYDTPVTAISVSAAKSEVAPGKATSVTAAITPGNATRQMVKWSSSDPEVATVNFAGSVVAKKEGKVTITATATDGSNVTGSVEITVKEAEDPIIAETHNIDLTKVEAKANNGSGTVDAVATADEIKFAAGCSMLLVDMSTVLADEDLTEYDQIQVKYQLKNADGTDADSYKVASPGWGNFALVAKGDLNGYTNPGLLKGSIGNYISDTAVFDLSELDAANAPLAAGFNLQLDGGSMTDSDQYMTITEIKLYKA